LLVSSIVVPVNITYHVRTTSLRHLARQALATAYWGKRVLSLQADLSGSGRPWTTLAKTRLGGLQWAWKSSSHWWSSYVGTKSRVCSLSSVQHCLNISDAVRWGSVDDWRAERRYLGLGLEWGRYGLYLVVQ